MLTLLLDLQVYQAHKDEGNITFWFNNSRGLANTARNQQIQCMNIKHYLTNIHRFPLITQQAAIRRFI